MSRADLSERWAPIGLFWETDWAPSQGGPNMLGSSEGELSQAVRRRDSTDERGEMVGGGGSWRAGEVVDGTVK